MVVITRQMIIIVGASLARLESGSAATFVGSIVVLRLLISRGTAH